MWYPPQQQQQCWHGYIHHLSSQQQQQQQQQQTYPRTSYYCSSDESSTTNVSTSYVVPINEENESFVHYQSTHADNVYVTGTDYYVTTSTGSYDDEMPSSSLPYQTTNTHWNPIIAAPTKMSITRTNTTITPSPPSSPSSCWDWLLYPPEIYSHLYTPSSSSSSSVIQQQCQQQDDDLNLLASLPTWLLALLYPSRKFLHTMDDENDSDQEINSLDNHSDEPLLSMNIDKKISNVSSNSSLSSENSLRGQKSQSQQQQENRSTTPDTDDGYQSASDACRSDYSQQSSLHYEQHNIVPSSLMPRRISYAAVVKPTLLNNKISPLPIPVIKTKNNSSLVTTNDNNSQKLKFFAPRFERMHHAKQYSSSSSSSAPLTNRTQIRSNNNNQRNHIINSTKRR